MVTEIAISLLFYLQSKFRHAFIELYTRIKSWEEGIEGLPVYNK